MLSHGRLSIQPERSEDRQTRFTHDKQRTPMTLWNIFRSPLLFGGDLLSTTTRLATLGSGEKSVGHASMSTS